MKTELNILMACSVILSACGSLKSNKTLHTKSLQLNRNYRESTNEHSWVKGNTLMFDTSNSEYVVQITPLGQFLYSADNGFEGVAEKVLISAKSNKRKILQQQQQMGSQVQQQKRKQESTILKTKLQHVNKSTKPHLTWVYIGIVIVLGLGCWLMRKQLFI